VPAVPYDLRSVGGSGSDLNLFARKVLIVAAVVVALGVLWAARAVLLLIFIAAVIAAGISPLVRAVRVRWRYHFHRKLSRGFAVMIVYLPFLVAVILLSVLIVPRLITDTRELAAQLPALVEQNILTPLEPYVPVDMIRKELAAGIEVPRAHIFTAVRGVATAIAAVMAVLVMVVYMLIDADRLRNLMLLIYPPEVRGERRRMLTRIGNRMSSWLAGQLLLSAIIGGASFIGFLALGIPYALPLAIVAAVGELIPMLGPTLSAIPALAVALLYSRWQFWAVLVFMIVLQKAENLFIVPRVMSQKVSISPLAVFIAFMIGATLLGIVGAILAIPIAAIAQVAFEEAFVTRRERRLDADRAGTLLRKAD
jgi:predicted PurR-regulated permease PerM